MAAIASESNVSSNERFSFTLFLAIALHAIILFGIGFSVADKKPPLQSLEITLAQYTSEKAPDEADFLAQANQEGSGDLDDKAQLSTTHVADFSDNVIREVQPIEQIRSLQAESQQTPKLITTTGQSLTATFKAEEEVPDENNQPDQDIELFQRNLEIASLEAQLRTQKQIHAKGPRKRQLTTASTKQARDAVYLDNWRKRIEVVGNSNYPSDLKLYGNMRLMVAINADGTVKEVKLLKSSGHKTLDDAALKIIRLAAPFEPFPAGIRKDTDILEIIRTWRFQPGNYLSSE